MGLNWQNLDVSVHLCCTTFLFGEYRRHSMYVYYRDYSNDPTMADKDADSEIRVRDGFLDSSANYTLFVELICK